MVSEKEDLINEEISQKLEGIIVKDLKDIFRYKIVYWGPGESGKTTNYRYLCRIFHELKITKGISVQTTDGRTLYADHVILYFDLVHYGFIIHLTTCTGQERFLQTRDYYLEGTDGVIFVGDSDPEKLEQNKRSFRELKSFTTKNKIPYIVQLNKRDLPYKISTNEFKRHLNLPLIEKYPDGSPVLFEAVAIKGKNVKDCFSEMMLQLFAKSFKK